MSSEITVKITSLQEEITIEGKKYILIPVQDAEKMINSLETLKQQNEEYKNDLEGMYGVVNSILAILGILDPVTGEIKQSIKTGKESYFKPILKSMSSLVMSISKISTGFFPDEAKEIEERFSFVGKIFPMMDKYKLMFGKKSQK